jgi:hypothetical protein
MVIRAKQFPPAAVAIMVIILELVVTFVAAYFVHRSGTPMLQALNRHERRLQSTIEFFGKVVDETDQPVAGAKVTVEIESANWRAQFNAEGDVRDLAVNRELILETDADGRFAVEGIQGYFLGIERIEKDGYEWMLQRTANSDGAHFGFGAFGSGQPWSFLSDRSRPIIFRMKRSGEKVP